MFKTLSNHRLKENRTKHVFIRNKVKKVVVRAMRMVAAVSESLNNIFKLLKIMKRGKDVEGERSILDIEEILGVKKIDRNRKWKGHTKIMNENY